MNKALLVAAAAMLAIPALAQMDPNCPMHKEHKEDAATVAAEKSPYVDRAALPIKALTQVAIDAYRDGTGMGLAVPAEMNRYPGPRHLLDMADKLQLTAEQRANLQPIFDRMHEKAVKIGAEIIDLERSLDSGFARGTITDAELSSLTRQIADRQGTLRFVHLQAHLAAKSLLTPAQIAAYDAARGYTMGEHRGHDMH